MDTRRDRSRLHDFVTALLLAAVLTAAATECTACDDAGPAGRTYTTVVASTQPSDVQTTRGTATETSTVATTLETGTEARDIRWPSSGSSPSEVFRALASQVPEVPIYLPKTLPEGFAMAGSFDIPRADGSPMTNPTTWNEVLGKDAGYGLAFTDGQVQIVLWVNPAADFGQGVEFEPVDAYLDGHQFSRLVGDAVVVVNINEVHVQLHGSSVGCLPVMLEFANALGLVVSE
ncbi:MAG: hypothetical protein JXA57_17385 [Armatimonadetes bacterium]|nr:hypothetical protein [Armatimonadota bacterium]